MSDLQVALSRSHFVHNLVVAANHFGEYQSAGADWKMGQTGWETSWDGGQNVHYPYEFVSLYFLGSEWGWEDGVVPEVWALHHEDDLLQGNRSKGSWFLRLDPNSELFQRVTAEQFGVYDLVANARLNGYYPEDGWIPVPNGEVPVAIKRYLERGIAEVRANFGQGGEFFE